MPIGDFNAIQRLLKPYFEHINRYPDSLLARIYGVYSVTMDETDPVYLILMGNSKKCENDYIKAIFDLKGSMVKREVPGDKHSNTAVLKDKNFLKLKSEVKCLVFMPDDIKSIINQLGKDITLLSQFNLMDYSLLFVIEYNPAFAEAN